MFIGVEAEGASFEARQPVRDPAQARRIVEERAGVLLRRSAGGCADDRISEAAMEDRKKDGYF